MDVWGKISREIYMLVKFVMPCHNSMLSICMFFPIGTDAEPNCPESASDIAGINLFTTKLNGIDIDIRLQQKMALLWH